MKKTMRFLNLAALVAMGAVMAACAKEDELGFQEELPGEIEEEVVTLTASVGIASEPETRALAVDGNNLAKTFAENDCIAVVYTNTSGTTVKALSAALTSSDITNSGKSANFTVTLTNPDRTKVVKYIYPAAMANDNGSVNYTALATQDGTLASIASNLDYCEYSGSWNAGALPTGTMTNRLAYLALTLKNVTGSSEITGTVTSMTISDGTHTYAVTRAAAAGPIYVAIQPTESANIEITATDGTLSYTKSLTGKTYASGQCYNLGWRMAAATPLTVEALTAGTVKVNIYSSLSTGMKYAVNGGAKTLITTTTNIAVSAGDKVQFYGNSTETQRYYLNLDDGVRIQGAGAGFTCKVYGNIMSLLDEENFATKTDLPTSDHNCFRELFRDNTALTDAGDLLLPAPALTLSANCYNSMFQGCTALTTAPALPATTLAPGCYDSMFRGCTALTAAPTLPATTLANQCYKAMFYGCTTLTTAPDLLAPTLVTDCYMLMFKGCTNLSYVKCLATSGIDMDNNTYSWLENVAATGTLAADNDATWPANSKDGIPSGWTRRNPDGKAISHALASAVVGEIVGSDGKAYAASDKDFLPSGVSAVAIVAYLGSAGSVETGTTYRGLAIAMSEANSSSGCRWYTSNGGHCVSQTTDPSTAKGYLNGIACTETLVNSNGSGVTTNCIGHTHAAAIAARSNNGTTAPTGCSNWFLPSMGQWQLILQGLTGKSDSFKKEDINPKITAAGGTINVHLCLYWSSTEYDNDNAWWIDLENGWMPNRYKVDGPFVRAALAF